MKKGEKNQNVFFDILWYGIDATYTKHTHIYDFVDDDLINNETHKTMVMVMKLLYVGVVNLEVLGSLFHFLLLLFLPSIFTSSSIFHFGIS